MQANDLQQQGDNAVGNSHEPEKYAARVPFKLFRRDIADGASIEWFSRELSRYFKRLDASV